MLLSFQFRVSGPKLVSLPFTSCTEICKVWVGRNRDGKKERAAAVDGGRNEAGSRLLQTEEGEARERGGLRLLWALTGTPHRKGLTSSSLTSSPPP